MNASAYWQEQVVLVTGGSRGIGAELAAHFSSLGAKVAINFASNRGQAEATLARCASERTKLYQADVGKEEDVARMMEAIEADLGAVSVLVNNAGQTRDGLLMTMKTEDWRSVMSTHLDGAFFCSRHAVKGMLGARHGRIVNISSVSGIKGTAGQTNYSAAKAGLIGFTRALAREMGKKKITCNAVALGVIDTEMTQVLAPEVLAEYKQGIAVKRFGNVAEVAKLVEYIAGPDAGFLTGQVITFDGGMI